VDAAARAPAMNIFDRLCTLLELSHDAALHWELYPKIGPHSLIETGFRRSAADTESLVAEIDRLCAIAATIPPGYEPGFSRSLIPYKDGTVDYSRTIDYRLLTFNLDGMIWLELRGRITDG
jgi:hypothetical protein